MERLKRDFGIRAILALILVLGWIAMIFMSVNVPAEYKAVTGASVVFYFSNRSTLDKP